VTQTKKIEVKEMRQRTIQKEKKPAVKIAGLGDFDLSIVGLTPDSIERSGGHIKIPIELIPFLKICKMPAVTRKKKADEQHRYLLKLRAGKVKPHKDRGRPRKKRKLKKKHRRRVRD
jgi:hypothetical protein